MGDTMIRDMEHGEDFREWFADLLERAADEAGPGPVAGAVEDRYLVLSNDVGDWIGGARFLLRGGVAHLLGVGVTPAERGRGHGHRLLAAFEERAREAGAHLAEFWAGHADSEALFAALGWEPVVRRRDYMDHGPWVLLEKRL